MWKLTVNPDNNSATLVCEDGNDNVVFAKPIEFTDFPKEGVTLWFANNVIYFAKRTLTIRRAKRCGSRSSYLTATEKRRPRPAIH